MTHELTVSGYFKNLAHIGDFINQSAAQAGLDERACYAAQMAVDEACANIIEHAYGGEGHGFIRLVCSPHPNGLEITIYDQGHPFDPTRLSPLNTQAPLEQRQAGGMGVFFIHKLMDRVEFKFGTPQGNQLTLFKRKDTV